MTAAGTPGALRPRSVPPVPLARWLPGASGMVRGVAIDSRSVLPGDVYVALPGSRTHGARFVAEAVVAGAVAVLTDAEGARLAGECGVPVLTVGNPRSEMAGLAGVVYGHPQRRLTLAGVTGTNGKTSTIFLFHAALRALGRSVGTIGTLGFRLDDLDLVGDRTTITTPESPDLAALLALMAERGADCVAMEVSSHALALERVAALEFDVAAFTMLGQDHLEFHHTLDNYFAAKARLFKQGATRRAVINTDDPWGRRLAEMVKAEPDVELVTTGIERPADYRVEEVTHWPDGTARLVVAHPRGTTVCELTMLGDFNVHNALTALAMVGALGLDVDAAAAGIARAQVPGRMQRVDLGPRAPHVVVDFAHTPQAVAAAVAGLPQTGRRLVVLGAGGDRDATKRGPMGAAAAAAADVVIVTDDNPRSEPPAAIREAVLAGARGAHSAAEVIDGGDRRSAIELALRRAEPRDWVAILGKGHETGQEISGVSHPFDDVTVAREAWKEVSGWNA